MKLRSCIALMALVAATALGSAQAAEPTKTTEAAKSAGASRATEASKPTEPAKPVEAPKATEAAKTTEAAAPKTKPASGQPAAADTSKKVIQATAPTLPDSVVQLEKAVARDSSKFDNLYRLGVMYLDNDQPDKAIRVLARAHKLKPKDLKTLVNLGAAHDARSAPSEARVYYRQALAVAPGDSVAMCRLAGSLYAQGLYQAAVDTLRDTIREKPKSHCAYFTLGVAFADAGIYRDAIRMWKKVVDLAPGSPEAVSARESIEVLEKFIKK